MGRQYQVISADGHVETPPVWTKYVPEQWQDRAPRLVNLPEGGEGWLIEGQPMLRNGQNITGRGPISFSVASYFKPDGSAERRRRRRRPAAARAGRGRHRRRGAVPAGVRVALPRGHQGPRRLLRDDARVQHVARRGLLLGRARPAHRQLRHADHDVDDAVAELKSSHALGLQSVAFYQFPNGTGFSEPEDDAFWAACLELGMAISPHFGFGEIRAPLAGAAQGTAGQAYASALTQRAGAHSPVYCMAQLMAAGVFDRFPDIKFYFAETNASWLPYSLYFMDDNHEIFSSAFGGRKMELTPSEYVAEALLLLDHPRPRRGRDGRPAAARQHHVGHRLPALGGVVPPLAGVPRHRVRGQARAAAQDHAREPGRATSASTSTPTSPRRRPRSSSVARLLVVHHTPSPAVHDMVEAATAGARDPAIEGVEVVVRPALARDCVRRARRRWLPARHAGEPRVHGRRAQALLRHDLLPVPHRDRRPAVRPVRARQPRRRRRDPRGGEDRHRPAVGAGPGPGHRRRHPQPATTSTPATSSARPSQPGWCCDSPVLASIRTARAVRNDAKRFGSGDGGALGGAAAVGGVEHDLADAHVPWASLPRTRRTR